MKVFKLYPLFVKISVGLVTLFVLSCGNPDGPLTKDDRVAELKWVIAKFEQNYAPLNYKQQRFNFKWEQLKADYLAAAEKEISNAELSYLITKFVAEVKDAHTSANQTWDGLPGKIQVAYLGFHGFRLLESEKDKLYVKELLPGFKDQESYPVKIGDKVIAVDDQAPYDFVKAHCARDIGQDESNKTAFLARVEFLDTFSCKLPTKDMVKLTVERNSTTFEVQVPWHVKDYFEFLKEQTEFKDAAAASANASNETNSSTECATAKAANEFIPKSINRWNLMEYLKYLKESAMRDNPMAMRDHALVKLMTPDLLLNPLFDDKQICTVKTEPPANSYIKIDNEFFDVRLYNKTNGRVGYIKIVDFMGGDQEVEKFKDALNKLNLLDAKALVIDLVNNPGGSLDYGLKLAGLLKAKERTEPQLEARLNDNWLNSYLFESVFSASATTRELAKRRYQKFKTDQAAGKLLSERFKYSELMLTPLPTEFFNKKLVLMVNEMCASMCDIFSADLKDNGVAKVIGKKAMGAGGNVVMHGISPRLGLTLNQTESLIVRANGEYIENQGIEPDENYQPVLADLLDEKYNTFITKAVDYALTLQ